MLGTSLFLASALVFAQEPVAEGEEAAPVEEEAQVEEENGDGIEQPKTMSGMSILGNEEAPKSLVIIPWKSSELGDDISLSDTLDDRAQPVDKEVFLRELNFYEIRAGRQAE
ncbi:MAG: hypothetical protein ACR2QV_06900 [Gammaproteobacteria bacterium]